MRLPMILLSRALAAPVATQAEPRPAAVSAAIPSLDLAIVAARGVQFYAFDQAA